MSQRQIPDGPQPVTRADADRRDTADRRASERREAETPSEHERRSGGQRRTFLRRVFGERRSSWPPQDPPPHREEA